jgi:hypothetical protein
VAQQICIPEYNAMSHRYCCGLSHKLGRAGSPDRNQGKRISKFSIIYEVVYTQACDKKLQQLFNIITPSFRCTENNFIQELWNRK